MGKKISLDNIQGKLSREQMKRVNGGELLCGPGSCVQNGMEGWCGTQGSGQYGPGCYCVVNGVGYNQRSLCP